MKNLSNALRALHSTVYVKTHNDSSTIAWIHKTLNKRDQRVQVFHPILGGLNPIDHFMKLLSFPRVSENELQKALTTMVEDDPKEDLSYYVFFEADELLWDAEFQRALRLVQMQREVNPRVVKTIILIGSKGEVPERLQGRVVVIDEMVMSKEAIVAKVENTNKMLGPPVNGGFQVPRFEPEWFGGCQHDTEIDSAISHTVITLKRAGGKIEDPTTPQAMVTVFLENLKRRVSS